MKRTLARGLLLLCALALGPIEHAAAAGGGGRKSAPLWSEIGRPAEQRARALLQQALARAQEGNRLVPGDYRSVCARALQSAEGGESLASIRGRSRALRTLARQALRRRAQLDNALARIDRALSLAPDDGQVLLARARLLSQWEQPGPSWSCSSERRDADAIAAFETVRARHPELAPASVAFDLAVLLTRSQRFGDAMRAYAEAAALALDDENGATVQSNLAEMTMLAGDLPAAVSSYERALRASNGGREYLLTLWGLAVALDRLGEHAAAIENATKALHSEDWEARVLHSDGVFFEPEHELDYYEALAHEAIAAQDPARRTRELHAAATSFRAFIAGARTLGPAAFAPAADAGLERVLMQLREKPPTDGATSAPGKPAKTRKK